MQLEAVKDSPDQFGNVREELKNVHTLKNLRQAPDHVLLQT